MQASSKILRLPIPKKHLTRLDQETTLDNKFKVTSDSTRSASEAISFLLRSPRKIKTSNNLVS